MVVLIKDYREPAKKFVKDDQDIEITGDEFKIFLRPTYTITQKLAKEFIDQLRKSKTILVPDSISIIIVYKNGEVKTL